MCVSTAFNGQAKPDTAGGGGASERGDDPRACLPVWLQKWAGTPDMVDPFLDAIGDSPAAVRWDFNAWPAVPELGLDIGGTRGAFVTAQVGLTVIGDLVMAP